MNRMYGSHGQIKIDPTGVGGATAVAVGSMNSWVLNMARAKADVTSFGDTNLTYVQGLPDIKGTLGGWFDTSEMSIFDVALGNTPCWLSLSPTTLSPSVIWQGQAYLDASIDVKATGAVVVNGNFVAAAAWARSAVP